MKTAWIFPGGSARAVYTAGVLYALCELDIPKPDIIIGCSGSSPTSLCYVTEQKEIIKKVWCKLLSTKKFLSFLRFWKILNIDYLVDEVLKKENPLDMKRAKESPIIEYFPVTNSKTGEIEYFSNKMDLDLWEVIRATVSVPFWTNLFSLKGVLINGKYYSDSPTAARYQLHVKKAIEEGATKIIVFDNYHPADNPIGYFYSKLFMSLKNPKFRKQQFKYFKEIENFSLPDNVKFLLIKPREKLGMSRWEIDNQNANKIFDRGYQDIVDNPKLRNF